MIDLLIRDLVIVTMDHERRVIENGAIAVDDGVIVFVGPESELPNDQVYGRVINKKRRVALPGLVNAHTHAPMVLLRGYADDLPLSSWLSDKIFPAEAKLTADDIYWGTLMACVEMLRTGTTTFADMYFFEDVIAKAVSEVGIRASLTRGVVGLDPEAGRKLDEAVEFAQKWNGAAGGRITTMIGPHASNTCPFEFHHEVASRASKLGLRIHTHIAETKGEVEDVRREYGVTPVELLREAGIFDNPVMGAHCVHLTDEDLEIMKESGAVPVHNPGSNLKLASGIARVPDMLKMGIPVALGTDGAASNNNLDMFEEIRLAALIHKGVTLDPTVVPAMTVLEMATINGAKALGLEDKIGSIEVGKRADIVLLDATGIRLRPRTDVVSHLVYSAEGPDVEMVLVDGKVVMEQGRVTTVNQEGVLAKAEECSRRILAQVRE